MKIPLRGLILVASVSTLIACGGGGSDSAPPLNEEPASVSDLLTEDQLAVFESLGLQLNIGETPPDIEGTFRIDPRILQASSVPNTADDVGNTVNSTNITFSNQDATTLTLDVFATEDGVDEASLGEIEMTGSSISGSANAFTAFFTNQLTFDGQTFEVAQAFSGIVTDAGIENFQQIEVVIDDGGDPGDFLNPNNTGLFFIDLDGFSENIGPVIEPSTVADFLTAEQLAVFESLGLQMNLGDNPPNIEGTFRMDPRILQTTTETGIDDLLGTTFTTQSITFSNQDASALTLDVMTSIDGADSAALGDIVITGAAISGEGNAFTAFFRSEVTFDGVTFEVAEAYSGIITADGIENFEQANVVLDDSGDPGDFLSPNNTGNLFIDLDGFSEGISEAVVADAN